MCSMCARTHISKKKSIFFVHLSFKINIKILNCEFICCFVRVGYCAFRLLQEYSYISECSAVKICVSRKEEMG